MAETAVMLYRLKLYVLLASPIKPRTADGTSVTRHGWLLDFDANRL